MSEFLHTTARRRYTRTANDRAGEMEIWVYLTESGKLLDMATLEEFEPGASWMHRESRIDEAVFVLLVRYTNEHGEECAALFGDPREAAEFALRRNLSRGWYQQRVRLVTEDRTRAV